MIETQDDMTTNSERKYWTVGEVDWLWMHASFANLLAHHPFDYSCWFADNIEMKNQFWLPIVSKRATKQTKYCQINWRDVKYKGGQERGTRLL